MTKPKRVEPPSPLLPYKWQMHEAYAIQQLSKGFATEEQQKVALAAIVEGICATYDEPYRGDPHDTAFACGKANVGRQIVKLVKLNLSLFTKKEIEPDDDRKRKSEPEPRG